MRSEASSVLVAEISGKRPGSKSARPTEKMSVSFDHVIISNNSDGYETEWDVVDVPSDYVEWYTASMKNSDNAWYAPMNRSYAIKLARERGYRYLVQLDDNIALMQIAYQIERNGMRVTYRCNKTSGAAGEMMDDYVRMLVTVLENTNAGIAGCNMSGAGMPGSDYLRERFCYSLFAIDLDRVPDEYHGDFEDDIEFRMKLTQMGVPMVQVCPLQYGKTAQGGNKDLSGCRKAYAEAGVKRGEHMRKLYGDVYSCGVSDAAKNCKEIDRASNDAKFKHKIKPIKLGVMVSDKKAIDDEMMRILAKYACDKEDSVAVKEKKVAKNG